MISTLNAVINNPLDFKLQEFHKKSRFSSANFKFSSNISKASNASKFNIKGD
jgi:hypothetical protein